MEFKIKNSQIIRDVVEFETAYGQENVSVFFSIQKSYVEYENEIKALLRKSNI